MDPKKRFAFLDQATEFLEEAIDVIDVAQQGSDQLTPDQRERLEEQLNKLNGVTTELLILAMED